MTAVQQQRPNVRRRGIIYGAECFDVNPETGFIRIDPRTGAPRLRIDYVGQSRQKLNAREEQHRDDKPWADLIVRFVELERGQWLDETLDEREIYWIQQIKPRYNDTHNRGNPERIEIWSPARQQWRQIEQRWARDDAAGRQRWIPPEQRKPDVAVSRPESAVTGASVSTYRLDPRRWRPWQQKLVLWSLAWIGATAVIAADLRRLGCVTDPWYIRPLCAGLLVAAVLVVSLWMNRRRWRRIVRMVRWLARLVRALVRAPARLLWWLGRLAG